MKELLLSGDCSRLRYVTGGFGGGHLDVVAVKFSSLILLVLVLILWPWRLSSAFRLLSSFRPLKFGGSGSDGSGSSFVVHLHTLPLGFLPNWV